MISCTNRFLLSEAYSGWFCTRYKHNKHTIGYNAVLWLIPVYKKSSVHFTATCGVKQYSERTAISIDFNVGSPAVARLDSRADWQFTQSPTHQWNWTLPAAFTQMSYVGLTGACVGFEWQWKHSSANWPACYEWIRHVFEGIKGERAVWPCCTEQSQWPCTVLLNVTVSRVVRAPSGDFRGPAVQVWQQTKQTAATAGKQQGVSQKGPVQTVAHYIV